MIPLIYSSMDMRDEFQKWLADGNARKYSPDVILSCMDRVSDYAINKKMAEGSLWEYIHANVFNSVYKKLTESKLFRIADRNTYKVFITADSYTCVF